MKTIKIGLYIRTSTNEGTWSNTQLNELRSYVSSQKHMGWELLEENIFIEEGSSMDEERPALDGLKKVILAWGIDIVLVNSLDRLFRKADDLLQFQDFLREHQVNLVSR